MNLSRSEPSRPVGYPFVPPFAPSSLTSAASNGSFFSKTGLGLSLGSVSRTQGTPSREETEPVKQRQRGLSGSDGIHHGFMHPLTVPASTSPIYPIYSPTITDSPSPSPRSLYTSGSSAPASPMSSSLIRPPIYSSSLSHRSSNDSLTETSVQPSKLTKDDLDWEEDLLYFYQPPENDDLTMVIAPPGNAAPSVNRRDIPLPVGRITSPSMNINASSLPFVPSPKSGRSSSSNSFPPLSDPIACRSGGRRSSQYYDSASEEDDEPPPGLQKSPGSEDKAAGSGKSLEGVSPYLARALRDPSVASRASTAELYANGEDYLRNKNSDSDELRESPIKIGSDKRISPYLLALQSNKANLEAMKKAPPNPYVPYCAKLLTC